MRRWLGPFGVTWVSIILLACSMARASFRIASDSVEFDNQDRTTTFSLSFDSRPDFMTTDHFGREEDSFQYFFDPSANTNPLSLTSGETIIRGEEIHVADTLRIRDALGDHSGPNAGGWGKIRGTVPFTVSDDTIRFTVGWNVLGQSNDHFRYAVETYEFGSLNDTRVRLIPLPSALWAGGATLMIVVIAQIIRSRHRPT